MNEEPNDNLNLALTPKEELAILVERLKRHEKLCQREEGKVRLSLAADLVRSAIFYAAEKP